ncbi:MAG: radical SAM protein, partial [Treponema sp.]|nr:radical SAM protein [Treponema sp.]
GSVYRPPSEARSLIIQATIGCAHNTCTFCSMYKDKKFRIRPIDDVISELQSEANESYAPYIERVFLADGDALVLKTESLLKILNTIYALFPNVKRVTSYACASDVLYKTDSELSLLKDAGLSMIYMGAESGDDQILKAVHKDADSSQMIKASEKLHKANILSSVSFISGLGGKEKISEHAIKSAELTSKMKPDFASFLTLQLTKGSALYDDERLGKFNRISTEDCIKEMQLYLSNVDAEDCVFRMNHASNCFRLSGTLNRDIPSMQKILHELATGKRYARKIGEIEIL